MLPSRILQSAFQASRPALAGTVHSLPVSGFVGAIGNTPLVCLSLLAYWTIEGLRYS